jgi:2-dehydro-3-deoxygluconokinase
MKKIVAYGEIMMRLTPQNFEMLEDARNLDLCYGGTESNVLVALAHLGDKTSYLTKLPDNQLGEAVKRHLLRLSNQNNSNEDQWLLNEIKLLQDFNKSLKIEIKQAMMK